MIATIIAILAFALGAWFGRAVTVREYDLNIEARRLAEDEPW